MKKSDLIAALAGIPDDADILVEGYESGFDRVLSVQPKEVAFVKNVDAWDGEFQTPDQLRELSRSNKSFGVAEPVSDSPIQAFAIIGRRGHQRRN